MLTNFPRAVVQLARAGRNGTLIEAVRNRHREMAKKLPHLVKFMADVGREREVREFL